MQKAFINVAGIPTHTITWGKWVEESLDDVKEIIVCVPGNPGLPGFYTSFLSNLYNDLNCEVPIWLIGHAGHEDPPAAALRQVPGLRGNERLFDLDAQIAHKVDFIENFIPSHVKIHLIGHSIGCWMILQMLKRRSDIKGQIRRCYFLFPTIERMVESRNGWIFTTVALPFYNVFGFFFTLFERLPFFAKLIMISIYFWFSSIPKTFMGTIIQYIRPTVMEKVVFLAKQEMDTVVNLDLEAIKDNKDLLTLYYGTTDGWVPIKYYEELKKQIPDIDAVLDDRKTEHAFVLKSSEPMAKIVEEMIRKNRVV